MAAVKALIQNPGPHGLTPLKIVDDAPKVDVPHIALCEPPNYTMGEKVSAQACNKMLLYLYTAPFLSEIILDHS